MIFRLRCEGWVLFFLLFLIFKPSSIASSSKECFEEEEGTGILRFNGNPKCQKFDIDLHTDEESLTLRMEFDKSATVTLAKMKMTIGGCDFDGEVSYVKDHGKFDPRGLQSQEFPVTFQASKKQLNMGAQKFPCDSTNFVPLDGKKAGFKVKIKYEDIDNQLSGLRLTFDKVKFIRGHEEEDEWSWSGWRIYACIAGGIGIVLLILGFIGCIFYLRRRRNRALLVAGQPAGTSTTNVTTATSKLSTTNASQVTSNTSMVAPQDAAQNESMAVLPKVAQQQQQVTQQAAPEQQQGAQQAASGQQAAQQPAPEQPKPAAPLPVQAEKHKSTESGHTTELIQQNVEKREKEEKAKQEQEQEKQPPRANKTSSNDKLPKASKSSKGSKKHKKEDGNLKDDKMAKQSPEHQPETPKDAGASKNQPEAFMPEKTQSEHSVMGDKAPKAAEEHGKPQEAPAQDEGLNTKSWELPNNAPSDQDKQHIREHFAANYKELNDYSDRHPVTQNNLDALGPWYRENMEAAKDHKQAAKKDPAFETDCQFFAFIKLLAGQRGLKWPPNTF
ncbi:hypothetical protein M3Y94_01026500 [Aphelenchoides besseyi]|nr:hypothetical protein M3Y94_01026500 [Aphelenchoides besseyi]KAI6223864.1 hypothetical protein M3Y95_00821600 [Aphelenchoides besseyi]